MGGTNEYIPLKEENRIAWNWGSLCMLNLLLKKKSTRAAIVTIWLNEIHCIQLVTRFEKTFINNLILRGTNSQGEKQYENHFPQCACYCSGLLKHPWEGIRLKRISNGKYIQ